VRLSLPCHSTVHTYISCSLYPSRGLLTQLAYVPIDPEPRKRINAEEQPIVREDSHVAMCTRHVLRWLGPSERDVITIEVITFNWLIETILLDRSFQEVFLI
jgi:hypothetical protein